MLSDEPFERLPVDPSVLRGAVQIPCVVENQLRQVLPFRRSPELAEGKVIRQGDGARQRRGRWRLAARAHLLEPLERISEKHRGRGQRRGAPDDVPELPYVAGPGLLAQVHDRVGGKRASRAVELGEDVLSEECDVLTV